MSDILSRLASLPPEKQRQLLRKIEEEGGAANAFPLSFSQERLWFLDQLAPGGSVYNLPAVLRFSGRLDVAALVRSRNEVVRRHEALRTAFPRLGVQPIQVVLPDRPQPLPVIDLSGLPAARREAEAREQALAETQRPFALARGPLLRMVLLHLGTEDHLLAVTMHHIVSDAWSIGVFLGELAALYAAFQAGRPSPLPEPRVQLRDFVLWQRRQLQGDRLDAEIEHWRRRLQGASAELDLPADRPRPPVQSFHGASWSFRVPGETAAAARHLSSRRGTTLFMTLLAAFEALLLRSTGREDLVVGTVVAQRDRPELEGLIGFLINTLVLRTDLSGDPAAAECFERVRETVLEAHAHQDLPFEKLVEVLQPERSLGHSPLFQVAFGLQTLPPPQLALPGLGVSALEAESRTAKLDLRLAMVATGDSLEGIFEYATDLFDATRIARMADHLCALLEAMVADPARPLSGLEMLAEAERHQLLREWNDTAGDPVWQGGAHERFARQAERTPDHLAVVFEAERLTYGELERRANLLTGFLRQRNLRPESLVGICLERSVDMIVAVLAVLKAGAAYLPLDPANPPDRLSYMLEDARVSLLLTRPGLEERLPSSSAERLLLEEGWETRLGPADGLPGARVEPDRLAYVIYTSGSTGRPKGVWLTHAGLCNHVDAAVQPGERVLQFSFLNFDASVSEIFMTLLHGATLVLARQESMLPGPALTALLREQAIDMLTIPPSALAVLPEEPLPGLRILIVAGEACGVELAERWGRGRWLFNAYGPTEAAICATYRRSPAEGRKPDIGYPIRNVRTHVLDSRLQAVPIGVPGELHIGGLGVGRGYLGRPAETAAKLIPNPCAARPGDRLYKTGDLARYLPDGSLEFLGRIDQQVKLRGFRIELGEIEETLRLHPGVADAAVAAPPGPGGERRLVAYVVPRAGSPAAETGEAALKTHLGERLPGYMLPSTFVFLGELPRNRSGKLDRAALPSPAAARPAAASRRPPRTELERHVAEVWREVLGLEEVGTEESFFDLGGHSLLLARVQGRLREKTGTDLPLVDLFTYPTVGTLAQHLHRLLGGEAEPAAPQEAEELPALPSAAGGTHIAIIGMALRVPGAASPEDFWRNLCSGVESISFFGEEELLAAGVPAELLRDPRYVRARGALEGVELFDAELFRIQPRQAALMDPQHRIFLECVWEALESAGQDPESAGRAIGLFAGSGLNSYSFRFHARPETIGEVDLLQAILNNEKDHLATRISYLLNLEGPSLAVQTSCSTSLVAVHLACQSLLAGDCGIALAGGVSIDAQPRSGYLYQEGGILSPDGHCRAFDAAARGTVSGSGAGVVVLKRLDDALRDGDTIHAVIRGSAINNDGSLKVGYTAPRAEGQARVIREAQRRAGVRPDEITCIEAHGTGTELGDPIEMAALKQAFRAGTDRVGFCAVTSLKTNVGHLDAAAGVAGLIKAALSLRHRTIPPSLHFERPNPALGLEGSPFYINDRLRPWEVDEGPRRAGVSSFGIGGTNAHVVLEEAPPVPAPGWARPWQLLVLSARTESALETATDNLVRLLACSPAEGFADIAYTLQAGRRLFPYRRAVVCRDSGDAVEALAAREPKRVASLRREAKDLPPIFLFPGQGGQYPGMGRELYDAEPIFRREIDRCAEILAPSLGIDLRAVLYPAAEEAAAAAERLATMTFAQPTLFVIEIALARLWLSWLGEPAGMIGHSVGEYAAACLAGVLSLEDALRLVAVRGRLMDRTGDGAMTAVPLSEEELLPRLGEELSIAAINGPARCVVSGPTRSVEDLEERLGREGVSCRRLHIYGAFHSRAVDPILETFAEEVRRVRLQPPRLPYVSTLTGTWIRDEEATDPGFWVRHLRHTVRFDAGLRELWRSIDGLLLEVGPGRALTSLVSQHPDRPADREVISSMRHPREQSSDLEVLGAALGRLWLLGGRVRWAGVHEGEARRRVPLPTHPFERRRYWIDAGAGRPTAARGASGRFQAPSWVRSPEIPSTAAEPDGPWLLVLDSCGVGEELARRLEARGKEVILLPPDAAGDGASLVRRLREEGRLPAIVVHLGSVTAEPLPATAHDTVVDGVLSLARAFQAESPGVSRTIALVSNHLHAVTGEEALCPIKAGVLALCELPELSGVHCRNIDLVLPAPGARGSLLRLLEAELAGPGTEPMVALRGRFRWARSQEPVRLDRQSGLPRGDGAWLVTGGSAARPVAAELARSLEPAAHVALAGPLAALRTDPQEEAHHLRELEAELGRAMNVEWMSDREGLEPALDRLCSSLVLDYFRRGGVAVAPGQIWREEDLRRTLRIAPAFRRFLGFLLALLQRNGLLAADGASLLVLPAVDEIEPAATLEAAIVRQYPEYAGLARLLAGCVSRYGEALSGEIPAIEVLYPQGRRSTALDEDDSPRARQGLYIELIGRFLARLADDHPGRELRILEVGAGTGILTRAVIAALAGRRVSYTFTDIGRSFVTVAELEAERQGLRGMSFRVLDISVDPVRQGFEEEAYDAVLGFNVVHATADLGESIGHLSRLLGPGGILALIEPVKPAPWIDLIWGLADGWWSFTDREIRQLSPLVGLDTWERVLRAQGLESVVGLPEGTERSRRDFGLVLGRKSSAPAQEPGDAPLLLASQGLGDAVREVRQRLGDLRRVLCVDPGAADLCDLAALLDEPGVEVVAVSSAPPAGIAERGVVASLAALAARPEGRLRLLRWSGRSSAREIVEVLERVLASELTEVLVAPAAPDEPAAASPEPAARASRQEERGNAIETRIAELWHELLGTSLGLHDNFFEKGADSLALLGLTAKIRDAWQVDLPLRRVLEEPTVAQLAAQVGAELDRRAATARARETSRTLVEIQAGRPEKVPFFTVHAAGGNVLCYYNLARHLGGDRPVYALQAPGVEQGEEEIFTRLEDLAAHHVAAVRTLRPHGPYLLGGWSAGGTIAFEMAQQLRRMGEEVLLVALMDTYAPQSSEGFDELRMLLWQAWRFGIALGPEDFEGLAGFDARLDRIVDLAFERGAIPPQIAKDQARRLLTVEMANLQAILDYRAEPYPGRLSYFRCAEGTDFGEFARLFPRINEIDHASGWTAFSPLPMPVFEIPGDHNVLMDEPAVGILARHLGECFAEVEQELLVGLRIKEPA
jgi:amino acid adenylation domain-containing protein